MKHLERLGVQLNIDSPNQLKQWMELFREKTIGIRFNIGDKGKPTCETLLILWFIAALIMH